MPPLRPAPAPDVEQDDLPKFLRVKEAAKYLRVDKSTLYRLLNKGALPGAFRVGDNWRIESSVLVRWTNEGGNSD